MFTDFGLLILRIVVGLLFMGHGAQKLFGWFGGHGLQETAGWLQSLRLRNSEKMALLAGLSEFGGGILLTLGILNPLGSLGIIASMLMAIVLVHWPKLWATENGFEYPLVNLAVASGLAFTGPGRYSIDYMAGTGLPMPETFLFGLSLVVLGASAILLTRKTPARAEAEKRRGAA